MLRLHFRDKIIHLHKYALHFGLGLGQDVAVGFGGA